MARDAVVSRGLPSPASQVLRDLSREERERYTVIGGAGMFIAMNRFKVARGSEVAFEQVWTSRDTHLREVDGFVAFHLLRGPERDDHVLYASHTLWRGKAEFEA